MHINSITFRGSSQTFCNKAIKDPKIQTKSEIEINPETTPKVKSFWGTLGALALGRIVKKNLGNYTARIFGKKLSKNVNVNKNDGKTMHQAINTMLNNSGLKKKGVRIKFLEPLNKKSKFYNKSSKECYEIIAKSETPYKDIYDLSIINPVKNGENAFFVNKNINLPTIKMSELTENTLDKELSNTRIYVKENSVLVPKNALHFTGFHELGHALNHNMSKFGKFLQKCRPVSIYAPIILGIYAACSKNSKPLNENENLNGRQKTKNFVRNNAGKLAFAMTLPMLLEEGMATIKGQKYAKKLLSPNLFKQVSKCNALAYCTYLSSAIFAALGVRVAAYIKDKSIENKEAEILAKTKTNKEYAEQAEKANSVQ